MGNWKLDAQRRIWNTKAIVHVGYVIVQQQCDDDDALLLSIKVMPSLDM